MKYVRFWTPEKLIVVEIFEPWFPGLEDIYAYFPAEIAALYTPAPDEVYYGWEYHPDTQTFTAPPPPPEPEPDPEPDPEEPSEGQDPVAAEPAGKA